MTIGVTVGVIAGYYRGFADTIVMRLSDVVLALPAAAARDRHRGRVRADRGQAAWAGSSSPGSSLVIFVISAFTWPYIARIVRSTTLSLREKEFVEAARSLGASNRRIILREILPNLVAPITIWATLLIPSNILFEAALSFLGLGVPIDTPSWGRRCRTPPAGGLYKRRTLADDLPRDLPGAHDARIQPARRRVARRARPEERTLTIHCQVAESRRLSATYERESGPLPRPQITGGAPVRSTDESRRRYWPSRQQGLTIAATTASAGSDSSQHAGAAGATQGSGRRRVTASSGSRPSTSPAASTRPVNTSARRSASTRNLLVRTLSATTTSPARRATSSSRTSPPTLGKITNGGKTYTFKLKDGVKFGPPLNRAITSKDILFAFQRIGTPSLVAQYGFYYDVIKGMTAF